MSELLIFGGTSEGRDLADFCLKNQIPATVSVATAYGESLLSQNLNILTGKLNAEQIYQLLCSHSYYLVIDATHPYAVEATKNIRCACETAGIRYCRLIRQNSEIYGETVRSMTELISILNQNQKIILSTLGSKSVPELMQMQNYQKRLWVRVLPSAEFQKIPDFPESHIIAERPPFSAEQNIAHIRKSGAEILLTKESGTIGGYP
ncbi:MAG: precorrin-6A/cobalt-precorrin-6A reductase, partial [Oscillospiraceae bacterium]|nr:precorrin-6A/cobalt-precorrin-6A reductase [Oscillospiraceae bacterium]